VNDKEIRLPYHQIVLILLGYFVCIAMFVKGMYDCGRQIYHWIVYDNFVSHYFLDGIFRMVTAFIFICILCITFWWADSLHEKEVRNNHVQ
jgi:hypothetical protein